MTVQSWILCDTQQDIYRDEFSSESETSETRDGPWSIHKRTLRGGKQDGVDIIEVNNGKVRLAVLPTRGMGLWKAWIDDTTLGWESPVRGPVHPRFVPLFAPDGLGWLDGFDELLVRCGLQSNGAPDFDNHQRLRYPLHGRIANLPAHFVEASFDAATDALAITGIVEETRFHFPKLRLKTTLTMRIHEAGFRIRDEVTNIGGAATDMQMLYHINLGTPWLQPGSQLVAPIKTLVPRDAHAAADAVAFGDYRTGAPGFAEQVYLAHLHADEEGRTQVLLKDAGGMTGVSLEFNIRQLPCFTQWKNAAPAADGYVTGLEPGTNFPNPRTYEQQQGRVVELASGQTQAFDLALAWHPDATAVRAAADAIARLQEVAAPQIFDRPQEGWCAP